jgi:hypothetical protein
MSAAEAAASPVAALVAGSRVAALVVAAADTSPAAVAMAAADDKFGNLNDVLNAHPFGDGHFAVRYTGVNGTEVRRAEK